MTWRRRGLAQLAAAAALVMSVASVFAYLYRVRPALESDAPELMPFAATLMMAALSLALLLTIPGSILQWIAFGRDTGARIQRTVAPLVLVVLPLLGAGLVVGLEEGWFDARGAAALLVTFAVTFSVLVAFWVGQGSRHLDEERDALLLEVRRVNQELEDRVRLRSHEVNRQRTKLALLEERDRIARDLHDRVIQRIFAAGLQIGALSRTVAKLADGGDASRLPAQLDSIAGELDLAIRELRNSIFQLTSIDDHQDLEQVVRDIASRSSRILGFMPQVTVTGDVGGVRSDLAADLASAIQEGLSNVARHARASAAAVSLEGTERELVVRITDDGIGLPDPLPRSSGISNLINRARGLGGTASWEPAAPTGTVFTWRIARDGQVGEFYGNDLEPTPPRPASSM
jgi:signal transduction histidine kinase